MLPITVITDFGYQDHYPGAMKLKILEIYPEARVVDITHGVRKHDVRHASYVLNATYRLGIKAVHLVVVDPGVGGTRECLAIELKNGFAVLPNNGIITPLNEEIVEVYEIPVSENASKTFHGRDVFAPAAAKIAKGFEPRELWNKFPREKLITFKQPLKKGKEIEGEIFHIDHFGNVITNIPAELVDFKIGDVLNVRISGKKFLARFVRSYAEGKEGEILSLINSENFLEFALNRASARNVIKATPGDVIFVSKSQCSK